MSNVRNNSLRGAVMIEFAIILPILVLLVFGFTELGRALYQWNTLTKAVATGARYMARANGNLLTDDGTCSANTGGSWGTHLVAAKNLIIFGKPAPGGGDEPILLNFTSGDITITSDTGEDGNGCVIKVEAIVSFDWIVGPLIPEAFVPSIDLTARTEERYIGE